MNKKLGLYIHIPFCNKVCPYCDFHKMVASDNLKEKYSPEIIQAKEQAMEAIKSSKEKIEDADLIVVLDQGKVAEMGNHDELIAHDGIYNKLYQTQFKGLET